MINGVIKLGFYLLFGLVPLLLTPWNYELFEYNKMMAVYGLTAIIITAWLIKMATQKEVRFVKTPLDVPILLFLFSQLLSALFSLDPHVSWFGYYSRFNGGMWSVISYVLLYYAFVNNFSPASPAGGLFTLNFSPLKIAISTASIVSLYGILERLGIDKHLWVQDVQNRVFSTLGQPNWLAAYLVALSPLAWALGLKIQNLKFKMQNYILLGISLLFFLVLLFTRSRSGLLGFAVADLVFWILLYLKTQRKQTLHLPLIIYHLAFIIVFLLAGPDIPLLKRTNSPPSYTAPVLESGGTESGTIRKYVWQGAILAWNSSWKTRLIGTGTETFAFAFYQHRPLGHNLTSEWDFLYNKAHNEYLNYLTTTGVFGFGSYLLFIVAFIYWFAKIQSSKFKVQNLEFALFAGWFSILVTNFFGFSVVVTQLFLFLFPAMAIALNDKKQTRSFHLRFPSPIAILSLFVLLVLLSRMWLADTLFAKGYRLGRAEEAEAAAQAITAAIQLNSREPFYSDELSTQLATLAAVAGEKGEATQAAQLANQALSASDRAIAISPANVNFWKSRTKVFYTLASLDPDFTAAAIEALTQALRLSPNDPKLYYNLAILIGRRNDLPAAIDYLEKAKQIKPNYRDAYWALAIFYKEARQPNQAKGAIEEYLTKVDSTDAEFKNF